MGISSRLKNKAFMQPQNYMRKKLCFYFEKLYEKKFIYFYFENVDLKKKKSISEKILFSIDK